MTGSDWPPPGCARAVLERSRVTATSPVENCGSEGRLHCDPKGRPSTVASSRHVVHLLAPAPRATTRLPARGRGRRARAVSTRRLAATAIVRPLAPQPVKARSRTGSRAAFRRGRYSSGLAERMLLVFTCMAVSSPRPWPSRCRLFVHSNYMQCKKGDLAIHESECRICRNCCGASTQRTPLRDRLDPWMPTPAASTGHPRSYRGSWSCSPLSPP
jgi:hypothetical protein